MSAKEKLNKLASKAKVLSVVAGASVLATASQAAVVYDETSGKLTGTLDMGGYNSALTIIIPAIVTIAVGSIILRTIKKI